MAEILVMDVDTFGVQCSRENVALRKLVANTLTNLSYGDLQRKQRLCGYPNFIECVFRIINELQILAQVRDRF